MTVIQIKCTNGDGFKIDIDLNLLVSDLKLRCQKEINIPPTSQKLIYKGKVLKDDDKLSTAGVQDNHTIILIGSKRPKPATVPPPSANPSYINTSSSFTPPPSDAPPSSSYTSPPPGQNPFAGGPDYMPDLSAMLNNPDSLMQTMQNPFIQDMMRNIMQNPELMRSMLQNNPMLQNPQNVAINERIRQMSQNPEMLRNMANLFAGAQSSPVGTNPSTGQNPSTSPEFSSYFGSISRPPTSNPSSTTTFNPTTTTTTSTTTSNPTTTTSSTSNQTTSGSNNETNPLMNWEEMYKSQLEQLEGMGFVDKDKNIALLRQTNGNVSVVIDRLLSG